MSRRAAFAGWTLAWCSVLCALGPERSCRWSPLFAQDEGRKGREERGKRETRETRKIGGTKETKGDDKTKKGTMEEEREGVEVPPTI